MKIFCMPFVHQGTKHLIRKGFFLIIMVLISNLSNGQQLELEWNGNEADLLRLIEGGTIRFAIEGHTASTPDRVTMKIRGVDALTLLEGGTVRLEVVSIENTADSVVVRLADGTLAVRHLENFIISYFLGLPNGIQTLLDAGECPLKILDAGALKSDLYGKIYQGGLIFYLDDLDSIPNIKGLVAAPSDQALNIPWGCNGIDLPIPNVGFPGPPSGPGAEIGDGATNTVGIDTASCSVAGDAAVICANLELNGFDDWFLPSAKELNLMWENLAANNLVNFGVLRYWSSTECGTGCAWFQWLNTGLQNGGTKTLGTDPEAVRAVRSF